MSEGTTWVKPHLQVLVQEQTASMLLDSGEDMSFITFELMEQLKPDWLIDLHSGGGEGYWYRTVNSNIPIFGKIVIPVTITDILFQSCTLMIAFIIIEESIPSLEKKVGDMINETINHSNIQILGLKADMNQRFDTQIHILDDLTTRFNRDQQNLKELIEKKDIQQQVDMKIIATELKQTEAKMDTLLETFEALMDNITRQSNAQEDYNKKTAKWQGKMELKINQLIQFNKPKEDSYALSSNDLRELPPHLASTPKSESIAPPIVEKSTKHTEVDELINETKLESTHHLAHQD